MSSLSNLYKGAFVNREETGTVVIDANELFEKRLEEKRQKERLRALASRPGQSTPASEDEFEGLDADQLEQLTADQATMGDVSNGAEGVFQEGVFAEEPEGSTAAEPVSAEAAQQALAEVQAEADRIIADAEAQAEEIRANAANLGHDEGYRAGHEEALHELTVQQAALTQKEKELEEEYRKLLENVEPEMVDTLTRIYEHIFAVRLSGDKSVILHLLQQALSRAEPTGDFLIHTSSVDYEALIDAKEMLKEIIPNPNCHLEIVEDTFLKENECMIETDGGVFDCGLGTELNELSRKLRLLSWSDREN